uniref:TNF receptor superfamily member 17 n=1 Tax=Neovison vison TaxID=452646 RepID=A0A8C7BZN2_NEOVI
MLFQMAQQCIQNEYFDRLLTACKPCHLRCSNTPPPPCQHYFHDLSNTPFNSVKGTNTVLWTCLGLSLIVSLTVFVLMFLLRKMNSEPSKDERKNTGWFDGRASRNGEEVLSRGLEYTVEECTCEDCVNSESKVDSDHFFPLPAMEEGATILVTTKTTDYCNSLLASVTEMEKPIFTR